MTYISSLSAKSGQVIRIDRSCVDCTSDQGDCLSHRCFNVPIVNWDYCHCSEDKCNANNKSNSSIQMHYFWPNLMLSFVIYLMFLY